jgi:uncharacterized membrane protein YuzA (DUF378 family)
MKGLTKFLLTLSIVGAINWGLVGFFNWNLVNAIFGGDTHMVTSGFSRIIYALVGLCGIALVFILPRLREVSEARDRRLIPPVGTNREVRP